jgi:hypothetical protein
LTQAKYQALTITASQLSLAADYLSQFEVAIRATEIITAARFSPTIYTEFNPDWKQRMAERNQQPR